MPHSARVEDILWHSHILTRELPHAPRISTSCLPSNIRVQHRITIIQVDYTGERRAVSLQRLAYAITKISASRRALSLAFHCHGSDVSLMLISTEPGEIRITTLPLLPSRLTTTGTRDFREVEVEWSIYQFDHSPEVCIYP
jgi:hypothetical protein